MSNGDQFDDYIDWFFDAGARLRAALGTPIGQYAGNSTGTIEDIAAPNQSI